MTLAAIAGCGGEDEPVRTATFDAGEPIRVEADEYTFDPGGLVVAAGARKLRITLVNVGELAHDIVVFDGDRELGGTPAFGSDEQRSATVAIPGGGEYRYVCTVGDHEALGMVGELEVRDGS